MLDNFTETTLSDNRPIIIEEYIPREALPALIFNLPFPFANYVQDLFVIYKQGLEIVLIKDFADCEEKKTQMEVLLIILSPVDTLKFEK